ncbi:MAG: NAD(P)H-dependent oxidoreductase [Pseudomonadota bacterium]
MANIPILNGAQPYPFAKSELNASFATRAAETLRGMGHQVRTTTVAEGYDVEADVEAHLWADTVILQFPVNWMGVPWVLKKYMDEVYTAGTDGRLCNGDGRSEAAPKANYGMGGTLTGTHIMLSVTLNAPAEAFDDPAEPFFEGMSVDDLLRMVHLNARCFGMTPLPTYSAHDVMKAPQIEADFARFDAHIVSVFGEASDAAA